MIVNSNHSIIVIVIIVMIVIVIVIASYSNSSKNSKCGRAHNRSKVAVGYTKQNKLDPTTAYYV